MKKLIGLMIGLLLASNVWAEDLYVQSMRAKLMAEPAFKAAIVERLEKGDVVSVKERKKRWVKVTHNKKQGWIPALLLSSKPPLDKVSVLSGEETASLQESARRRASVITTAGASRGLQGERGRGDEAVTANYDALKEIEAMQVPQDEIDNFLNYLNTP